MAQVLCLDADTDLYLAYVLAFRTKLVFDQFTSAWTHHAVQYLSGAQVIQPGVNLEISANPPAYITAAGHGLTDSFIGFGGVQIWNAEQDLTFLTDTIVHLLSCDSGVALGPAMIRDGVRAFWGYTRRFLFSHEIPSPKDLSQDTLAERLIEMDCLIDVGVLDGLTADEIYEAISDYYDAIYAQLDGDPDQELLVRNYECLVGPLVDYGASGATI